MTWLGFVLHVDVTVRTITFAHNIASAVVRTVARRVRMSRRHGGVSPTKRTSISALDECLPNVILQPVGIRKLLDEMLDCVLAETEEVRPRDRIRVCAIADVIRSANDNGPSACGCTRHDGFLGLVVGDNLEIGTGVAIEDLAVVDDLGVRIASGKISTVRSNQ